MLLSCILQSQMFIGRSNGSTKAQITWKYDFSDCGLVVKEFRVKGRCGDSEDIEWRVIGDERVGCCPLLAGEGRRGRGGEGGEKRERRRGRGKEGERGKGEEGGGERG